MDVALDKAQSTKTDLLARAEGLGVQRQGRWLVRGVSLDVHRGEIVTLIGPNGSGKSTTVRALLGLMTADEGTVTRDPTLRVGYVPQKLSIDWTLPLTVKRFMTLTERHDSKVIAESLDEVGISHLADNHVQGLSGGEFQRLLLARAVAGRPDLLVLDEPVQGVDATGEIALYKLIADLRRRYDCGILLISHDLHVVMAETDTVICLNGHVCCSGEPSAVAQNPEYLNLFGHRAAEALAVYHHHHDHTHLPDGRVIQADGPHDHSACTHPQRAPDQDKGRG